MRLPWPRTRSRRRSARRKPATLRLPFTVQILAWLAAGVATAAGTAWVLWILLGFPELSVNHPAPLTADDKFNGLKIALTVVGGIGGVIALTVAYRKQRLGEAAERREDTKLFTERFTKAAEQLGSDKAAVRLAGVYAMAGLADDWDAGQQTCIDVLCAYLRMPYDRLAAPSPAVPARREGLGLRKPRPATTRPLPLAVTPAHTDSSDPREEQQVRHTVIRVIAEHLQLGAPSSWQGRSFDFTEATFDGGDFSGIEIRESHLNFSGAKFVDGKANFRGAGFTGGNANFGGVEFSGGDIDFGGAGFSDGNVAFDFVRFSGGNVNFRGATFSGSNVNFGYAQFNGGDVDFGIVRFSDGNVNFRGATFSGSNVNFGYAQFNGGEVNFNFVRFSGGDVNFRGARFSGANLDFFGAEFIGGDVRFHGARFSGGNVTFREAEFSGGNVDLSEPRVYDVPPEFDALPDGPPVGLLLPGTH